MGLFGKSKVPEAPDPYETASVDAQFNRANTYGPDGSAIIQGYTDKNGKFVQGIAPKGMQSAVKSVEGDAARQIREVQDPARLDLIRQLLAGEFSNESAGAMPGAVSLRDTSGLASTLYERQMAMMRPDMDRSDKRLMTMMQARGLPVGGEAFNEAYGDQKDRQTEQFRQAALDAEIAARQEQQRLFGLDSAVRDQEVQNRNQTIADTQQRLRQLMLGISGDFQPGAMAPTGTGAQINYAGLVGQNYENQVASAQSDRATKLGALNDLASIGTTMFLACSSKMKDQKGVLDIAYATRVLRALPLSVWRYKPEFSEPGRADEMHAGPMAEDLYSMTGFGSPDRINPTDLFALVMAAIQVLFFKVEEIEREIGTFEPDMLGAPARIRNIDQ